MGTPEGAPEAYHATDYDLQAWLETQGLRTAADKVPRWPGAVELDEAGNQRSQKPPSPLVADPQWRNADTGEWYNFDIRHTSPDILPNQATLHKAVALADLLAHPYPTPLSPIVLVRGFKDRSVDMPAGLITHGDRIRAVRGGQPHDDYALVAMLAMLRNIAEDTKLRPKGPSWNKKGTKQDPPGVM